MTNKSVFSKAVCQQRLAMGASRCKYGVYFLSNRQSLYSCGFAVPPVENSCRRKLCTGVLHFSATMPSLARVTACQRSKDRSESVRVMTKMNKLSLNTIYLVVAFSLISCNGANVAASVLYKPTGTLQCSPPQTTQARLDAEVTSLQKAGASVVASHCADDGAFHVALCGAENGDLFSVSVSPASESLARQLGCQSSAQYPSAQPIACQ